MPMLLGDGTGEDNGRYFRIGALAVDPVVNATLRAA
jgi:hypothetical protein